LQVLAIIQPPYSPDFTAVFLPLIQSHEIAGPLTNSEHTDPLSTFLAECSRKSKKKRRLKQ